MAAHDALTMRLCAVLAERCGGRAPLGVAVSGGGDSMALLHLLVRAGVEDLQVATVDHRLRPEAAEEAAQVARAAASLGLTHRTLVWSGWNGRGNLQDAARRARQRLLGDWARDAGLGAVVLGHTRDDQAETLLLRLARGSGVDGLAAMAAQRRDDRGMLWLRPLLDQRRADLRDWLRAEGIAWIDDPSNEDPRFDRVRARRLLAGGQDLGLDVTGLAETAERMAAAAQVLNAAALTAAQRLVRVEAGAIYFDADLWQLPDDTCWRLLAAAHCQVSGNPYRPRLEALRQGAAAARAGRAHTLHGCLMRPDDAGVWILPELRALEGRAVLVPGDWGAWRLDGPAIATARCAPLGDPGLQALDDWRSAGLPYDLARVLPGVWDGDILLGAPVHGMGPWTARLRWGRDEFNTLFISH